MENSKPVKNPPAKSYRAILQNIICQRYADANAALVDIDVSFQANKITEVQRRQLSYLAHKPA